MGCSLLFGYSYFLVAVFSFREKLTHKTQITLQISPKNGAKKGIVVLPSFLLGREYALRVLTVNL